MEWVELLTWVSSFWAFATLGVPAITEFIYEKIKEPETKLWKSIWSWLIPIILTYLVWVAGILFDIGFLIDYEIWWVPGVMGSIAAALSNYSWENIPWIKDAVIYVISLLPKKKTKK